MTQLTQASPLVRKPALHLSWPKWAWWQWGKLLGGLLPPLLVLLNIRTPLIWALALHLLLDFTAQSTPTARAKSCHKWSALLYHGCIAGGWTGLLLGGLPGLLIGAVAHVGVDAADKFGWTDWRGPLVDQLAHILVMSRSISAIAADARAVNPPDRDSCARPPTPRARSASQIAR